MCSCGLPVFRCLDYPPDLRVGDMMAGEASWMRILRIRGNGGTYDKNE